jgi:electron transfer flavoprotein alpha subunit
MLNNPEILIVAETANGELRSITLELCALARKLADNLSGRASAILIGPGIEHLASELITFGMDRIYTADDAQLQEYNPEAYTLLIEQICKEVSPEVLLFGQTLQGRDLAPRLAFRLRTGLATDCVDFAIDSDSKDLLMTRPVYGSKALATVAIKTRPQVATLRSKAFSPAITDKTRQGEILPIKTTIDPAALRIKFIQRLKQEAEGPKLEEAKVIVSGGRGLGRAENFDLLKELASLLGGVIGGSRVAVDNGWLPSTRQVGLTGTIVSPRLYFAVGISGAAQHMAGCASSQYIIAINTDPDAPIFRRAHYGIVEDYKAVVTAMIQQLKGA